MLFEHLPYSNFHNLNLDWILREIRKISDELEQYVVNNQITFSDPINWIITGSYAAHMITKDPATDTWYISRKPVPPGILISNGEYWEELGAFPQAEQSLICNVQDYGVMGVAGADYTAQLQEALDHTEYIAYYFPAGTYSFGTVYTSRPVTIFGAGETTIWKPLHRIATSNQYKTMLESTGDLELRDIQIVGDNSVQTQTGQKFLQTAIIRQYGHKFRMIGCTIDQIYDTWHAGVGSVAFPDREGLLLYVKDAEEAEIDSCTFKDYGGEELCWISRSTSRFGDDAPIRIHDNVFMDKTSPLAGSTTNVLGGTCLYWNNRAENYLQYGSHANLVANIVHAWANVFTGCDMPSVLDTCEGYYIKNRIVDIHDNYFDDVNGVTQYSIKTQAKETRITNNHLEGICPIKTYAMSDPSLMSGTAYIEAGGAWPDYDRVNIEGNTLILTSEAAAAGNSGISIGQTNSPAGSRSTLQFCSISNNIIRRTRAFNQYYNPILTYMKQTLTYIKDNIIETMGTGTPGGSRAVLVSFAETLAAGSMVYVTGNDITEPAGSACTVINGIAAGLADGSFMAIGNTMRGTGSIRVLMPNAYADRLTADYNLGFTSNAG